MLSSLEKLQKFFRLEHESGYQNRAVIGGLSKILDFWVGEARNEGVPEEIIEAVTSRLNAYQALPPQGRADSLKGLWKRIKTLSGEGEPEAARPARVESAPAPAPQTPPPAQTAESQPQPATRPQPSPAPKAPHR
ncbi:MAG: hypothetical protein WHV44_16555, partial [Anaerolineales bacterium]